MRWLSAGSFIFIHSGLRRTSFCSVGMFLIGIKAILSASRYLTPRSI
ncbi:Uncharacterised protein [Vibrio cholerae]|nr:Uncharacterised protein [Vibrio cholerae]